MLVTIYCVAVCLQLPHTIIYLISDEKKSLWPGQYDDMVVRAKIYLCMKVAEMLAMSVELEGRRYMFKLYKLLFQILCISNIRL